MVALCNEAPENRKGYRVKIHSTHVRLTPADESLFEGIEIAIQNAYTSLFLKAKASAQQIDVINAYSEGDVSISHSVTTNGNGQTSYTIVAVANGEAFEYINK